MAVIVSIVGLFQIRVTFLALPVVTPHCCRVGNIVTVFLKSVACPVSKCILIGLCSIHTVNREGFSVFFCVYSWGAVFYRRLRYFCFLCTFGAQFFTDTLFSATVYVGFASVFNGQEWVKSVKFQFNLWMWNNALSQTYALFVL